MLFHQQKRRASSLGGDRRGDEAPGCVDFTGGSAYSSWTLCANGDRMAERS